MNNTVIKDGKDFVKKHGRLLLLSMVVAVLCYGFLVFSGNIRIDTEELINEPGTTLGWLKIGRYSLVLLKRLLGLSTHHILWSALLFLLFFSAGGFFLAFLFYHASGKSEDYPYGVFILLYGSSNIWCYQVYFSLQQAEMALRRRGSLLCPMQNTVFHSFLTVKRTMHTARIPKAEPVAI